MENDVCEDGVCSVYVWCLLNVRDSSLGVCSELCPVCFPIVYECVSVLLYSVVEIVVMSGEVVCCSVVSQPLNTEPSVSLFYHPIWPLRVDDSTAVKITLIPT